MEQFSRERVCLAEDNAVFHSSTKFVDDHPSPIQVTFEQLFLMERGERRAALRSIDAQPRRDMFSVCLEISLSSRSLRCRYWSSPARTMMNGDAPRKAYYEIPPPSSSSSLSSIPPCVPVKRLHLQLHCTCQRRQNRRDPSDAAMLIGRQQQK